MTTLLTSHYMRDVEALCDRVIVINHGKLVYDGPLARIVERFSETKLVKLQFEGDAPDDLGRFGEVVRREGPFAEVKVGRGQVAAVLAADPRSPRGRRRERGGAAARGGHLPCLRGGPCRT